MKRFTNLVKGVSSLLDKLAGVCIFAVMLLIVSNIVLRSVFQQPILGTYEIAGFLSAIAVGLALAHCAVQNGHIAVGYIMDRLPKRIQSSVDIVLHGSSFVFWTITAWYLVRFGHAMKVKGLVSPSAEIPVYPFIYLVAFGIAGLSLVQLLKTLESLREAFRSQSWLKLSWAKQDFKMVKRAEQ